MIRGAQPGIHLFSAGVAWENAFAGAVEFLRDGDGVLLLGPAIGDSAREWLLAEAHREKPFLLGARVQEWREWIKGRARTTALDEGLAFRVLNDASLREYFRSVLSLLSESGAFHHLGTLWQEERFFRGLLDCVEEARMAGLSEDSAIERAKELLTTGSDQVTKEAYSDLWSLLTAFARGLEVQEGTHDYPSLVKQASSAAKLDSNFYLLGFDHLAVLETDLLQLLAREHAVFFPVALPAESIRFALTAQEQEIDHTALLMVRTLVTGFPGNVELHASEVETPSAPQRFLLEGHAPSEEIRAAAALGKQALSEGKQIRYVLPPDCLEQHHGIFREELGLPKNFYSRKTISHPVARLFFHALELKEKNYELAHGLEFAQLLQFTTGKFLDLPARATRAGIREGLADWKKKSEKDPILLEFTALLEKVEEIIPLSGHSGVFAEAVKAIAELGGMGELARRAFDRDAEREAHAALASLLRHAQMLAASVKGILSFPEFMREWFALIGKSQAGEALSFFPSVQFYHYGEWLPPAGEGTVTVALRWDASVTPHQSFTFFFEEAARRKLSDFSLPSQVQAELSFLDQMKRISGAGIVLFSWSRHDSSGKELEPSWIASALPFTAAKWPEVARSLLGEKNFRASEVVRVADPKVHKFSASLLELYKECPFRAFALKVLRLEDKMQAASLDLGHLELGNIVHRCLELYYGEHKAKSIAAEKRGPLLDECLKQAVAEQKIEYFKGNLELLQVQINRLRKILLAFVAIDAENYEKFPHFRDPDVEKKVSGKLGAYAWEGKIDRIDVDEAHKRFLVIDYKSGAVTPATSELDKLERFQLQLYMDAAQELYPGYEPAGALYVSLKTGERKQGMVRKEFNQSKKEAEGAINYFGLHARTGALKDEETFNRLRDESRAEGLRLAEEINSGNFDVKPISEDSCKRCEVRPACRIREIQSPPKNPWNRVTPDFSPLFQAAEAPAQTPGGYKGFNEEQQRALDQEGRLVFIEASAGTGKTTVIVEKIRRFLTARVAVGDPSHRAVERFSAISFTEKSAQELSHRVAQTLITEAGMGPRVAAQAIRQIGTIHGFCRRILSDFPVEAGISPMAELMDERETEIVRERAFEEFFLHPSAAARPASEELFALFPRAKIEGFLRKLLSMRLLLRNDLAQYRAWMKGEAESPGNLVPAGEERLPLEQLLFLGDEFSAVFEGLKRERDALDFNDLEGLSLRALSHEHVQKFYREKFSLLLVDEFQDTNSVQREILERIAQPGWQNLFVVGDAKQSIYRFRAADVSVFQGLRKEAEEAGNLITLFRNYRSRRELVEAANLVTESIFPAPGVEAPDYEAVAARAEAFRPAGGKMELVEYGDPETKLSAEERRVEEARLLVEIVQKQIARGREPGNIAVLMRKMSGNEAYLRALTFAGIPFRVGSSRGFYSQSVILDGIALLRTLYGASNDMALLAVLRSPWLHLSDDLILEIQRRRQAKDPLWECVREEEAPRLFAWKKEGIFLSCSELLEEAYRYYPLDRREHLQTVKFLSLLRAMEQDALPRVEILERISNWAGWEREEDSLDDSTMPEPGSGGAVQVMTVHSAKGLEFDVTILPDLSAGLQPDRSALRIVPGVGIALKLEEEEKPEAYALVGERNKERDLAESKRLLYVALTRAKEECILLIPRRAEGKKKKENWAEMLSGLQSAGAGAGTEVATEKNQSAAFPVLERPPAIPDLPIYFQTSITEVAAFQFCGEFHRRKFVQGWDDQVVALWPKPGTSFRASRAKKKDTSPEREEASRLLRLLGIENKERGIALHRVLERVQDSDLSLGELWLNEAYSAQGVDPESEELASLVRLDLQLLRRFLASPLGRELFAPGVEAYPEISFQWRVPSALLHGAMDRLIRRGDGAWVVVDYKSSILEESLERYRFQVASYMSAIAAYARSLGEEKPVVLGYLVDLYSSSSHAVEVNIEEASRFLDEEILRTRANYTLADEELDFGLRGIRSGEHCFSCPYSLHCEIGREFVLTFK